MKESACMLIMDGNLVLAVSRKDNPNDFGLPGGKREPEDECLRHTARRECQEETGIYALPMQKIYTGEAGGFECTTFIGMPIHQDIRPEAGGGQLSWVTWAELFEGTFGEYNRELFEALEKQTSLGAF